MKIGDEIRRLRLAKGWSQEGLAVRAGLTKAYGYLQISAWEIGRQRPHAKNIVRLCDALGVTADQLLTGSSPVGERPEPRPPCEAGEVWKEVPGYEGHYLVSSLGRLFSVRRETSMAPAGKLAYERVIKPRVKAADRSIPRERHSLFKDGKLERVQAGHLVLLAFKGPPPGETGLHDDEYSCNHINGDPDDNRPENLEWLMNPDHRRHTVANGLHAHHESHGRAKLNWEQVREIRRRYTSGDSGRLAREFEVSKSAIYSIVKGVTWREDGNV